MPGLQAVRRALAEGYPPPPAFKVEDIPDLTGKVMIVTGANTGVSSGAESMSSLADRAFQVSGRKPRR